jgi:hypothetical protein
MKIPHEIQFGRNIDNILAHADESGIWVICGWTLPIPKEKALEYVRKYNTDPNSGFFEHYGNVILSHNSAKITFSQEEADAIVALIKAAYLGE